MTAQLVKEVERVLFGTNNAVAMSLLDIRYRALEAVRLSSRGTTIPEDRKAIADLFRFHLKGILEAQLLSEVVCENDQRNRPDFVVREFVELMLDRCDDFEGLEDE